MSAPGRPLKHRLVPFAGAIALAALASVAAIVVAFGLTVLFGFVLVGQHASSVLR